MRWSNPQSSEDTVDLLDDCVRIAMENGFKLTSKTPVLDVSGEQFSICVHANWIGMFCVDTSPRLVFKVYFRG